METTLSERRKKLGLTQSQVAVLVGVMQGTVAKAEAGKMPESRLKRWAQAYRVTEKKFEALVSGASWEVLPLWKFAVKEVQADVEVIRCKVAEVRTA